MFDTFRGLPVHSLVVHGVVVLVPLAALGLIAIAVRPVWRKHYATLVALTATVALAMVPVALASGNKLKARLHAGGVVESQIKHHQQMGQLVLPATAVMWVAAIAVLFVVRRRVTGRSATLVSALAVIAALVALVQVALAGDAGSTAVWGCTLNLGACK